jgi:hypothetical protein
MLLLGIGVGTVAGARSTVLGRHADETASTCRITMEFEAAVRVGPSAGTVYAGTLEIDVQADGAIDGGALTLADETTIPVVGQVTGRSISLIFAIGEGQTVFGTGLGQDDLAGCPAEIAGKLGGPFAGPTDGDLGDWRKGKPGKGVLNLAGEPASLDKDYEEVGTKLGGGGDETGDDAPADE